MNDTRQEMFNKAVEGLASQGFRLSIIRLSISITGQCRYRNPNGNKCAIGYLIPDESYNKDLESLSVSNAYVLQHLPEAYRADVVFLSELQRCHDRAVQVGGDNKIQDNLIEFARQYELTLPESLKTP